MPYAYFNELHQQSVREYTPSYLMNSIVKDTHHHMRYRIEKRIHEVYQVCQACWKC